MLAKSLRALVAMLLLAAAAAAAQPFPNRPVTIVVPYAAGGGTDAVARALAQALTRHWSRPVVVENVAGADGLIGAEKVIRAPADGYTMMIGISQILLYRATMPEAKIDVLKELKFVSMLQHAPISFAVAPVIPARDFREFAAYCKASKTGCTWGSATKQTQLIGRALMDQAGIPEAVNINYKGTAPMLTDVLGGHVSLGIVAVTAVQSHQRAGTLKVLNVGSTERYRQMPNVPTLRESGIDLTADTWYGLMVPAGTPPAIFDAIAAAVKAVSTDPQLLATIEQNGGQALFTDPGAFAEHVRNEAQELDRLLKKYPPPRE